MVASRKFHLLKDDVPAFVAELDSGTRSALADALRRADSTDNQTVILDQIKTAGITRDGQLPARRRVVGVLFTTMDYDNGYYLYERGTVLLEDGRTREVDFGATISEAFTDEYGCVGRNFTLAVDLRTNDLDGDDSYGTIQERFRLKVKA